MEKTDRDGQIMQCRKLGHMVPFSYCRKESVDEPCGNIIQCWMQRFPVIDYLNERFGSDFLREFVKRNRKDKFSSIIEILDKNKPDSESKGGKN